MKNIFTLTFICTTFLLIANNNNKQVKNSSIKAQKEMIYEMPPPPPVFIDSFFETFDSETAQDWLYESEWRRGTSEMLSSTFFMIPNHGIIAAINDDAAGEGVSSSGSLVSPPIIRIPDVSYLLNFNAFFINGDYQGNETAMIQISTDRENWTTLLNLEGSSEWQNISLIIPPAAEEDTLYIAFNYDDGESWNFGLGIDNVHFLPIPDYYVVADITSSLNYTQRTLRQTIPLEWEYVVQNLGSLNVADLQADLQVITPAGVENFTQTIETFAPEEYTGGAFSYIPEEVGGYEFYFSLSHPELGTEFFSRADFFELSDSLLAKDDGRSEGELGFGFGDPAWYGYYGNEFQLVAPDTVTAISIYISPFSTVSGSSINLIINGFDEAAKPTVELYHSAAISLADELQTGFVITHQLPEPITLSAGLYVFAAGQDTLQGIVGFQFDHDNILEEGFWIISPIAGGGYPWFKATNRESLMIRPHLKVSTMPTAIDELETAAKLTIFPNPCKDHIQIEFPSVESMPENIFLSNATGKQLKTSMLRNNTSVEINMENLPSGIYFIHWMLDGKMRMDKVIKQ